MATVAERQTALEESVETLRECVQANTETLKGVVAAQGEALDGRATLYERTASLERRVDSAEAVGEDNRARAGTQSKSLAGWTSLVKVLQQELDDLKQAVGYQRTLHAKHVKDDEVHAPHVCDSDDSTREDMIARTDELYRMVEELEGDVEACVSTDEFTERLDGVDDDIQELREAIDDERPHQRVQHEGGLVAWETFKALERRVAAREARDKLLDTVANNTRETLSFAIRLTPTERNFIEAMRKLRSS